ncbi:Alanine--glyoxylate aminotransferase 2 mitochondrial [Dissostichus eleginoides]|uniref:Alanine--glyoxylate aminotransferase 2, mitochondrial n=1 Tax=Dissostichus eleginoides TaxID=100907 RepID=A0AAD9BK21_DISEL|nr:Alanine--glyoxylate aminotransferase 2 mitochondrial [Dissostichus eleginoides]
MFQVVHRLAGRCAVLSGQSCCSPASAKLHLGGGAVFQKPAHRHRTADLPEMPSCDFKPEEYKGMSKERIMEIRRKNCNPMTMKITYYKKPVFLHQGYMQWLWDFDGNRYLDLFAGVATVSVGHCHPKVAAALQRQLKKLWHTTNIYVNPTLHEYSEKLASHLPDPLKVVYLTNSGSEANDLAMLMARLHTGNFDLLTLRGSYHGGTQQTMGLTSNSSYKYPIATSSGCTNVQVHGEEATAGTLLCRPPDNVAVPKGMGGAVQYPKNYLKEAYQLVRERGGVCIADEVQTGFGRTGSHFWGFQGHDVLPDMVTMAKGIGDGFPMGAVVTTPEIAASFAKAFHFNTFGGGPLACAVASSVLDTIKEDGTQQNSHNVGTYLMTELAKLRDTYEIIGDVRGKGLQIGVEMASRDPLSPEAMSEIFEDIKNMGVLIGKGGVYGQAFRIQPPMCITKEDVNFFLAVFKKAIQRYMDKQ